MQLNGRLAAVHLDFDLSLEFEDGAVLSFSELTVDAEVFDEDNQFEGLRRLAGLVNRACLRSEIQQSGTLVLEFDDESLVVAAPRDEVESWEFTAADGATMVCLPGGEIESMPAPERYSAAGRSERPVSEGSTVVRVTIGRGTGVEFSDRAFLSMDVPLDKAYLLLRESADSVQSSEGLVRVKLSSGQTLIAARTTGSGQSVR